jgi:PilZ domain
MLFFKRILKEAKPAAIAVPQVERRSMRRYAINPQFPIKAVLSFIPRDHTGAPMSNTRHGWNWKGVLVDCSEQGARIRMGPTLKVEASDLCDLILKLDAFELTIPCHIVNIVESAEGMMFGLKHDIEDETTRTAYGQLLEVLALGSALRLHSKTAKPDESGYLVEHYVSNRPARLSVWRHPAHESVAAFEFQLKEYLVRAAAGHGLQYLAGAPARTATPAQAQEIRRLFHWVVPNLAAAVPAEVREFLQHYAT